MHEPKLFASQELLFTIFTSQLARVDTFLDFNFLHQISLRWGLASVVRSAEILRRECVIEEVAERIVVQNTILRISIVAKKDWVERSAILLCHPVDAINVDTGRLGDVRGS